MTKQTEKITTKRFPKDDDITGKDILTLAEKLGSVEMELNRPVEMEGGAAVDVVVVEAPTSENMIAFDNRDQTATPEEKARIELQFYGSCCVNLPSDKVKEFHAMDTRRLQRLVTNFV